MKKIFALLALIAFIGVVSTPASATVIDNTDTMVQISIDDDNTVVADKKKDKEAKKKKKADRKAKKASKTTKAASAESCGSVKASCGEASSAGCGSSCTETKKEVKK